MTLQGQGKLICDYVIGNTTGLDLQNKAVSTEHLVFTTMHVLWALLWTSSNLVPQTECRLLVGAHHLV